MIDTIQKNMLKHQVGYQIFCKTCQKIMDCKSACSIDVYEGKKLVYTYAVCAPCHDENAAKWNAIAERKDWRIEVTDGRKLFGRRKKTAA